MSSKRKAGPRRQQFAHRPRLDDLRGLQWLDGADGQPLNRAARRAKRPASPLPRPLARLGRDGTEIGYYADPTRWDDCMRAAIATATQIPIEQVPDPRLHDRWAAGDDPDQISDESWLRIAEWADRRGLQLMLHETVPADRERWIGICVYTPSWHELVLAENPFPDHCLIMSYGDIIFDPAAMAVVPSGMRVQTWKPADVTYGLSFDLRERE